MIIREVRIYCDGKHRTKRVFPPIEDTGQKRSTIAATVAAAIRAGWSSSSGTDYCPGCARKHSKAKAAEEEAERKTASEAEKGAARCLATMSLFPGGE